MTIKLNTCNHNRRVGDNYGVSCADCGKQLSGYGYGGWFGKNITGTEKCIHLWSPIGEGEGRVNVCVYCETLRDEPKCACLEYVGDNPECPKHGHLYVEFGSPEWFAGIPEQEF